MSSYILTFGLAGSLVSLFFQVALSLPNVPPVDAPPEPTPVPVPLREAYPVEVSTDCVNWQVIFYLPKDQPAKFVRIGTQPVRILQP